MMSLTSGREMDCCSVCMSPSRTGSRVKSLTKWQRPSVELTALEDLKAHCTFDDEAPVALRRRDAPAHAAREAQVVTEVVLELRAIFERDRVPDPAAPARAEETAAQHVAHRAVGQLIVGLRLSLSADRTDDRGARASGADASGHARIRPCVDEDSSIDEDPSRFLEGIDHALSRHSSERPWQDRDLERPVGQFERLCRALAEGDVSHAKTLRLRASPGQRGAVGIDREDPVRPTGGAESETAFARADVRDTQATEVDAVRGELDLGRRPQVPEPARH